MADYTDDDLAQGQALAEQGMQLAADAEGEGARAYYLEKLHSLLPWQEFVTSDDLWAIMSEPPEHPRMLGVVWKDARKLGWIEDTGERRKARRPGTHAGEMKVYRSKLFA